MLGRGIDRDTVGGDATGAVERDRRRGFEPELDLVELLLDDQVVRASEVQPLKIGLCHVLLESDLRQACGVVSEGCGRSGVFTRERHQVDGASVDQVGR